MKSRTHCALCERAATLCNSHILPAFVFRWAKETSITGYLRFGGNPRRRAQDGLKLPLLCADCEALFNEWETRFATTIFHPYTKDSGLVAAYGDWMLRFCVSISWRVLTYFKAETGLSGWTPAQQTAADEALARWRAFLLRTTPHPGPFEQHLLPLSPMSSTTVVDLPPNMNRYMARGLDLDVVRGKRTAFVYSKMGRFALFGLVVPTSRRWKGTRVAAKNGMIRPSEYDLPIELLDYMKDRAAHSWSVASQIPKHQLDKIDEAVMRDLERVRTSDQFAAMLADAEMFGVEAVVRK